MYNKIIKRIIDLIISITVLILLFWLFIIISIFVKITSKGPILFIQRRIGINKKEFYMIKFRTMYADTPSETPTHLLHDSNIYITPFGKILRKTSLDELPQLVNVLLGHMSIIGPRPALWNQYDLIENRDKLGINRIKPGLTGWAQVNGRDELTIKQKVILDKEYLDKVSFLFDLKCLLKTLTIVFNSEGVKEGI